jgi:hypothetical protein
MQLLDFFGQTDLTRNQRLGHYFTVGFVFFALIVGLNLRNGLLYDTIEYFDPEAGIRANYPVGWLVSTRTQDYIFQAEDTSHIGFKTTLQISTVAIAPGMTARNVFDDLNLARGNRLADYNIQFQRFDEYTLPNGEAGSLMEYSFTFRERNPFQQFIPTAVLGRDILVLRRGQAILITFLADEETYTNNLELFDRFLASLDF